MSFPPVDRSPSGWIGILLGTLVLIGGLVTLTGWYLEVQRLTDWFGSGISMMPNTALSFTFLGLAMILRAADHIALMRVSSIIAGSIGLLTLVEHIIQIDLGIDRLLVDAQWGQSGTIAPGRMGMPACFMFMLMSTALLISGGHFRSRAGHLATACIAISLLSVVGYLYGAQSLYVIPKWTAISLGTGVQFIALAVALIISMPDVEPMRTIRERSASGALVRRALPFLIILPIILGWTIVYGAAEGLYEHTFGTALRTILEAVLFTSVLWWMAKAVDRHEKSLKISEAALRASDERYRSFIENSSEGIWRIEMEQPIDTALPASEQVELAFQHGMLAECNDAMARMYGFNHASDLIGARLGDLMPRTAENEAYLKAFINSGHILNGGESEERDKDGLPVFFSNNLVGIVENGKLLRAWGTQSDITDRKLTEEALRESDRRKDEFLATLAHELRNPLAPLVSGLELLTNDREMLEEGERRSIEGMMRRQLEHMVRLIEDLMDVDRINRGKIDLRFENVDITPVITGAVEACQPLMEQHGHQVKIRVTEGPLMVNGDPIRLAQIFQNVLNNAAKYTRPGGQIELEMAQKTNEVIISVKDNGIGLSQEDIPKIFEMFGQIGRPGFQVSSGLGIGLALVRRLVEKHGGSIAAQSDGRNKGSTFIISLPLVKEMIAV